MTLILGPLGHSDIDVVRAKLKSDTSLLMRVSRKMSNHAGFTVRIVDTARWNPKFIRKLLAIERSIPGRVSSLCITSFSKALVVVDIVYLCQNRSYYSSERGSRWRSGWSPASRSLMVRTVWRSEPPWLPPESLYIQLQQRPYNHRRRIHCYSS